MGEEHHISPTTLREGFKEEGHMSNVACHVSRVACHVSHVTCNFFFIIDKVVELVGLGSVINGAYPV